MAYVRIWIHLIWSTKNRQRLITSCLRPKLLNHILENAKQKQIYVDQINCVADHCHALISLGSTQEISTVASLIKGESSYWLNSNKMIQGKFEWQDEYLALSVGESQIKRIRAYITNQVEHHRRKSFSEEYDLIIQRYHF
ncbi:MAG TPA: IS200/IS605 family transposase [Candidatus Marinimicrobia bacterium]|nr:IS200/IS605 family transposase [Candidatus Neomarinimicrobiota bacterium]